MWVEIDLDSHGDEIRLGGRGSRGERPTTRTLQPDCNTEALRGFSLRVARAARSGRSLDPLTLDAARGFYDAIFPSDIRSLIARMHEQDPTHRVVVRLFTRGRGLGDIPFEALCQPGTMGGFVGTDPRIVFARGVSSPEPWAPREVRGAVRLLVIAPGSDQRAVLALEQALAPSIAAGEIEWIDPIVGPDIGPRALYDKLRRVEVPHVVHFIGHGGMDEHTRPVLRMADDADGEEVWLQAEAFARELAASFCDELRLVVLEACEGAKEGAMGSAANILARCGADAVVAHLWPVRMETARICSMEMYRTLTGGDKTSGDIGASVAAARRTLLATSAEAFSPILYLRGADSVIFDFECRRVSKPARKGPTTGLPPALGALLEHRRFSMIVGDFHDDHHALKAELAHFMAEQGDALDEHVSLFALNQRCLLKFGQDILHSLFQQSLSDVLAGPPPPLIAALGAFVTPGVHVTLFWRPYLERAIAEKQPHRTIYTIQPSLASGGAKPRIVKRAARSSAWKTEPVMPKRFDLDNDIVVLRLYGGYSAETYPIFSQPVLTEDDHFHGLLSVDGHPAWMDELLHPLRTRPSLLVGLSILDWRHRMILRWLFDRAPFPKDSIALLDPRSDACESEILDGGGATSGIGRIAAIVDAPEQLASQLDGFDQGRRR